ncbi:MAG: restriction endonuclease subunit S [Neisseriales bacterium]|nr:MAG: restriction endonuclease subunit S [Neisseriales bacterium]
MDALLNDKLQNVEWGEFKIGDLFEKLDLVFKKAKFDKLLDVSKVRTDEFNIPLVNAKNGDNGIMYYGRSSDFESAEMTIDIVNDGAVSTGNVYAQPQRTGVLYNAYLINPKFEKTEKLLHFFATTIQKSIKLKFGYENKASWEKVKNEEIRLPIKNGEIDFEFMENFIAELEAERIAELEAERIAELEAYLHLTGLKNYTLTDEEQQALDNFNLGKFQLAEFTYESIFNKIIQGRRLRKEDQIAGNIPFVMAGVTNTGVVNYISNPVASFPKNSITIDIFGNTFYRNYPFGAGDDTGVYWNDDKNYSKETMLFFASVMSKSISGKFSYGKKLRSSQSINFKIHLPTKTNQPDYKLMETFISAIQKLVIKDVVLYADKKIAATKIVVNR